MLKSLGPLFLMFFLAVPADANSPCEILKNCIRETQNFAAEINRPAWVYKLESEGLSCKKNNSIFECVGKTKCSPEPVHFFGAEKLLAPKQMHLHFHGHNITGDGASARSLHFDTKTGNGDFAQFLKDSGAQTLLIVPESRGKVDTFAQLTRSPDSTTDFFKCLRDVSTNTLSKISLSSHSGSDRILNQIFSFHKDSTHIAEMEIKGVGLFDSLYAARTQLYSLKQSSKFPFWNAYVAGGSTQQHQNQLQRVPASPNYRDLPLKSTQHMEALKNGNFSGFLKAVSN